MLFQLLAYGLPTWLCFIAIALAGAWWARAPGIILGHVCVAIIVAMLDMQCIVPEMCRPDWGPDQDGAFLIALLNRIAIINTLLLPAGFAGLWLRRNPPQPTDQPSP